MPDEKVVKRVTPPDAPDDDKALTLLLQNAGVVVWTTDGTVYG